MRDVSPVAQKLPDGFGCLQTTDIGVPLKGAGEASGFSTAAPAPPPAPPAREGWEGGMRVVWAGPGCGPGAHISGGWMGGGFGGFLVQAGAHRSPSLSPPPARSVDPAGDSPFQGLPPRPSGSGYRGYGLTVREKMI